MTRDGGISIFLRGKKISPLVPRVIGAADVRSRQADNRTASEKKVPVGIPVGSAVLYFHVDTSGPCCGPSMPARPRPPLLFFLFCFICAWRMGLPMQRRSRPQLSCFVLSVPYHGMSYVADH